MPEAARKGSRIARMDYLVGDVQGCCAALERLLGEIGFSPSRDRLYVLGDLVNRGPASLATLELLHGFGQSATCLLGNHDLHLLAVAHGVRRAHPGDTFGDVLASPRREAWLEWLRARPLAVQLDASQGGWLLVHAGVAPQWSAAQTVALAGEVQAVLQGPLLTAYLNGMYGDQPSAWTETLTGPARWRFITNVLTRIRFCSASGALDLATKEGLAGARYGHVPWFEHPERASRGTPIAFGHWASLGLINTPGLLALDTGCVWGRSLTAVRVDGGRREVVQVACAQPSHA